MPTDGVEDYCRLLGEAFSQRNAGYMLIRVAWEVEGWLRALSNLWRKNELGRAHWALVQYTALMWSRRGFPLLFLAMLLILRFRKVRVAVIFHDPEPFAGRRLVDRLRRSCQLLVMRSAYRFGDRSIFSVPLQDVSWLSPKSGNASFIPVGGNVPAIGAAECCRNGDEIKTIAVFTVTDDGDISKEVSDIALAARRAADVLPRVRLLTLGRGSSESEFRLRQALEGSKVEFAALGVLPAEQVSQHLGKADISLFVRGPLSTQRGSAIASVACGLPLVAYAAKSLSAPLAQAGILTVRYGDGEGLAEAAVRVLTDDRLSVELRQRSQRAYEMYFSWKAVASRFTEVLENA